MAVCGYTDSDLEAGIKPGPLINFMNEKRTLKKYICGVDWQHEWDQIREFYPTIQSIKHHRKCWEGCGIVELEVKFNGWVEKQELGKNAVSFSECERLDKVAVSERIETLSRQLEALKLQVEHKFKE